ncbi:MAG: hypothetical protein PHT07_09775 [Paludibacter sp.]|nr:hypothetical protein [Paludibacter sp.]
MKKILVLVMIMVATSATTFAINPNEYGAFNQLNKKSTFNSLIIYLGADKEQADYLKEVFNVTTEEFKNASNTGNNQFAENVLNYNLHNAKCILSEDQYRMYLKVLNLAVNNKLNDLLNDGKLISDINK